MKKIIIEWLNEKDEREKEYLFRINIYPLLNEIIDGLFLSHKINLSNSVISDSSLIDDLRSDIMMKLVIIISDIDKVENMKSVKNYLFIGARNHLINQIKYYEKYKYEKIDNKTIQLIKDIFYFQDKGGKRHIKK